MLWSVGLTQERDREVANPPLTTRTLREYAEYTANMVQQLRDSQHLEEATQARELYRLLDRLLADRRTDRP
jgi:cytochrome P450